MYKKWNANLKTHEEHPIICHIVLAKWRTWEVKTSW